MLSKLKLLLFLRDQARPVELVDIKSTEYLTEPNLTFVYICIVWWWSELWLTTRTSVVIRTPISIVNLRGIRARFLQHGISRLIKLSWRDTRFRHLGLRRPRRSSSTNVTHITRSHKYIPTIGISYGPKALADFSFRYQFTFFRVIILVYLKVWCIIAGSSLSLHSL